MKVWCFLLALICMTLSGSALYTSYNSGEVEIRITPEYAKRALEYGFERSDSRLKKRFDLELNNMDISIESANHILFSANVQGEKFGRTARAHVRARGTLEFRNKAFYFRMSGRPEISNLEVEKKESGAVRKMFRELMEPVKQVMLTWVSHAAESVLARRLRTHPVYRLKDDQKGLILRAILERVKVEDGVFVATLKLDRVMNIPMVSVLTGIPGLFFLVLGFVLRR